jgi:hypothetical protein
VCLHCLAVPPFSAILGLISPFSMTSISFVDRVYELLDTRELPDDRALADFAACARSTLQLLPSGASNLSPECRWPDAIEQQDVAIRVACGNATFDVRKGACLSLWLVPVRMEVGVNESLEGLLCAKLEVTHWHFCWRH